MKRRLPGALTTSSTPRLTYLGPPPSPPVAAVPRAPRPSTPAVRRWTNPEPPNTICFRPSLRCCAPPHHPTASFDGGGITREGLFCRRPTPIRVDYGSPRAPIGPRPAPACCRFTPPPFPSPRFPSSAPRTHKYTTESEHWKVRTNKRGRLGFCKRHQKARLGNDKHRSQKKWATIKIS